VCIPALDIDWNRDLLLPRTSAIPDKLNMSTDRQNEKNVCYKTPINNHIDAEETSRTPEGFLVRYCLPLGWTLSLVNAGT
jgi:hypothetical protein